MAAVSHRLNSGRLLIMSATVWPRSTPRAASPAAIDPTRSAYSRHVISTAPPGVRNATRSGLMAADRWNASHRLDTSRLPLTISSPLDAGHPRLAPPAPADPGGPADFGR